MNEERGRRVAAPRPLKQKHVPVRTCVICRQQAGKRELSRIVRAANGIVIDPTGKQAGRGAYLCDNATCWEKAAASDSLAKALRITLTPEDREQIRRHKAAS